MLLTSINPLYKGLAALILIISLMLTSVYFTSEYKDGQFAKKQLETAEAQAEILKIETDKVRAKEQEVINLQTQLEGSYAKENNRVNEVLALYNGLINDGFRLRDPRSTTCKSVPTNGSTGSTNGNIQPTSGGELSAEATRFLLEFATDADKVVNQFKICRKYATELRNTCSTPIK